MPQYRKLYSKVTESFDFNDLPDDFSRLLWLLLPTQSCRLGRGVADDRWLRSKLFPLRDDIKKGQCLKALDSMQHLGMLTVYCVNGRHYYEITNWTSYQGNTTKEADSPYPSIPEVTGQYCANSGVSPELVQSKSVTDAVFSIQYSDADTIAMSDSPLANTDEIPTAIYAEFLQEWANGFPHKSLPRASNKTLASKLKTRLKSAHFRDNWKDALYRGSTCDFLLSAGWFDAGWFLKNDENYEKVLNGNYDNPSVTSPQPTRKPQYVPDASGRF